MDLKLMERLLITQVMVNLVACAVNVDLDLLHFDTQPNHCCDGQKWILFGPAKCSECDLYFNVCVRDPSSGKKSCMRTSRADDTYSLDLSQSVHPNHLHMQLTSWKRSLQLDVDVKDYDLISDDDAVDHIVHTYRGNKSSQEITMVTNKSKLLVRLSITCTVDFYGQDCTRHCTSTKTGHCSRDGYLVCQQGYTGEDCKTKTSPSSVSPSYATTSGADTAAYTTERGNRSEAYATTTAADTATTSGTDTAVHTTERRAGRSRVNATTSGTDTTVTNHITTRANQPDVRVTESMRRGTLASSIKSVILSAATASEKNVLETTSEIRNVTQQLTMLTREAPLSALSTVKSKTTTKQSPTESTTIQHITSLSVSTSVSATFLPTKDDMAKNFTTSIGAPTTIPASLNATLVQPSKNATVRNVPSRETLIYASPSKNQETKGMLTGTTSSPSSYPNQVFHLLLAGKVEPLTCGLQHIIVEVMASCPHYQQTGLLHVNFSAKSVFSIDGSVCTDVACAISYNGTLLTEEQVHLAFSEPKISKLLQEKLASHNLHRVDGSMKETQTKDKPESESSANVALIAGTGCGSFAVILVIVIVAIKMERRKNKRFVKRPTPQHESDDGIIEIENPLYEPAFCKDSTDI